MVTMTKSSALDTLRGLVQDYRDNAEFLCTWSPDSGASYTLGGKQLIGHLRHLYRDGYLARPSRSASKALGRLLRIDRRNGSIALRRTDARVSELARAMELLEPSVAA